MSEVPWKLTSISSSSRLILVIHQRAAKHRFELVAQGLGSAALDFQAG